MVKIDIVMPTYCYDCPCHNGENGRCNITGDSVFDKRPFDCPLREDKSTADVEEVKRGEWIEDGWNVVCSSCGVGKWKGYVPGLQEAKEWMPRCPNCGAKMDGKEEE